MAITTMDQLVSGLGTAQSLPFCKNAWTTPTMDLPFSLWTVAGFPGVGASPAGPGAGGSTLSSASTGAIPFANPSGGAKSYLARLAASARRACHVVIYDRLWHCGPISFNGITSITNPPDMPRYSASGYAGLEIWLEFTGLGAALSSYQARYGDASINQPTAGNKNTLAVTRQSGWGNPGEMLQLPLPQPDGGVQFVDQVICSAADGGTGNVLVMKRLGTFTIGGDQQGVEVDFARLGLPEVADNACLALMVVTPNTGIEWLMGEARLAQG